MTFRVRWARLSAARRLPAKEEAARFVKTLYSSGLVAARDEARRMSEGGEPTRPLHPNPSVLEALGIKAEDCSVETDTATIRRVARDAVTLLRLLQSREER
jgi:hypothetical protein